MPEPIPPIYVNGIPCAIALPDGRVAIAEASGPEGPEITIPYKCAWADRWNLVAALRGTCTGNITNFQRSAPYSLPGFPNLVCTSVGQFGYIGSGANPDGSIFAAQAIVPATFSAVPWMFADGDPAGQNDSSGQAWTVTKVKPSAEV